MKISKGPYTSTQSCKAIVTVIRGHLHQHLDTNELPRYFHVMLEFESYLDRLHDQRQNVAANKAGLNRLFLYDWLD